MSGGASAAGARVPEASAAELPRILAVPPWEGFEQPVLAGLAAPDPRTAWRDGEREEWLDGDPGAVAAPPDAGAETLARTVRDGGDGAVGAMLHGPEDVVRPLLAGWKAPERHDTFRWMRVLLARYEVDAVPPAAHLVKRSPRSGGLLAPFLDAGVAVLMGGLLGRGDDSEARWWFRRHGTAAVAHLVPAALGTAKTARRSAERALRHLAECGEPSGGEAVVTAARVAHGDAAAEAVARLLAADPLETGLARPPKPRSWADPAGLPRVLLAGGRSALTADATRHLLALLALPPASGLARVKEACDPASLAEFGWALFRRWQDAGGPSQDGWALARLGWSGDDGTARRLAPVIRAWPGEGRHGHALTGLDVLAEIGTGAALAQLHGIAQQSRFAGVQDAASRKVREVARSLGLTPDQLADRLVPGFGLDAAGTLTLDYGPRRFTVGFDEALRPVVTDQDGAPRKALPKPGAKDDPALAPAAYEAFAELKKDVRDAAAGLLLRFEKAMVERRRWTPAEFRAFVTGHPLVRRFASGLVWIAATGDGAAAFRIAEDGTLADSGDDAFDLPEDAAVEIAHPVRLGGAGVAAWAEVFADYAILQPFPQLGRPVHALTAEERESGRLRRFENLKVPYEAVLALARRGWDRGRPQDGGVERWVSRFAARGRCVVVELDPGIYAGDVTASADHQTLRHVWLGEKPALYRTRASNDAPPSFGELDPVTVSEILADLTALTASAA
ncbi:DUF4132 domain-containing protein [Actinomadura nitritigenes]|uniref:DUF4132 domain-containing protein n=1 Tax=Actinomadura nitritigenes TaxID=134602 RepID=UPI003D925261